MISVIAIDGISGSGKSSTARLLARALEYRHVDTGAMYRMLTYAALQAGLQVAQAEELGRLAEALQFTFGADAGLRVNGQTLPAAIRDREVTAAVSEYCQPPAVRRALVRQQRALGLSHPSVVEGRDIGTVVFPDAPWKFFLTARPEIRARRRAAELAAAGLPADFDGILRNLQDRDAKDSARANSPLKQAEDAVVIDTSDSTLEQQVAMLTQLVRKSRPGASVST